MNTNKYIKFWAIVCVISGIIIAAISFTDINVSAFNKAYGLVMIVVGTLVLLNHKKKESE